MARIAGARAKVFRSLLSKAAFMSDSVEQLSVLTIGEGYSDKLSSSWASAAFEQFPSRTYGYGSNATTKRHEVHGLCIVWLLTSLLACLIVASELVFEFYIDGHRGFHNQMVTGFKYDLIASSEDKYSIGAELGTQNPMFWVATFARSVV